VATTEAGLNPVRPPLVVRASFAAVAGVVSLAFLAAGALLAVVLPYSEWDSFAFGDWSRQIAVKAAAADPIVLGSYSATRPLFYELQGALWAATGVSFTAGRLLSLAFAMLLLAAVWWLAGGPDRDVMRAALAVVVIVSIPAFTDEALMGQTDVPAAAMVALTSALALAAAHRRGWAPALVVCACLSVLAKPITLTALVPLAAYLALRSGRRTPFRSRLRGPAVLVAGGLAVGLVYDLVMATRLHQTLLSFLRSGTGDGLWGLLAARERWDALLDLGLLGPALRLPLACGLVYATLSVCRVPHRSAAAASLLLGSLWTVLGPALSGASGEPGSFSTTESAFATIGFAAILLAAATADDDAAAARPTLSAALTLTAPAILVWAYGTPYSDRLAASAWPGAALLIAATLVVGVQRLAQVNTVLALSTVPVILAAAWAGLSGLNGLDGQQWASFRELGWAGLGDKQRTMNLVLPGIQEALADAEPALGEGRLAVEDPRFAWFLPNRVDTITPLRCSDVSRYRVFVLSTSDENEYEARAAGGLATPEQWQRCSSPSLRLIADTDNGYAIFAVSLPGRTAG